MTDFDLKIPAENHIKNWKGFVSLSNTKIFLVITVGMKNCPSYGDTTSMK